MDMEDIMLNYNFVKNYKNHEGLRTSFNSLANKTFGIDFESWYQKGYWNDNYICYSYTINDEVVSNVSLSTMTLLIDGALKNAIQIGTVMTSESHRRKGLAIDLMERIFKDYDSECDFYFLAADDEAVPLYEKCDFRPVQTHSNVIDVVDIDTFSLEKSNKNHVLEKVIGHENEIFKSKVMSEPLTDRLWATNAEHIFMFYYVLGFKDNVYKLKDDYYVYEIKDGCLYMYDVISQTSNDFPQKLSRLLKALSGTEKINEIKCYFTPQLDESGFLMQEGVKTKIKINFETDENARWMIRSTKTNENFPKNSRFPSIAQA